MMRQPWFVANSRSSFSDISRKTRNSADCVTTYSELIESLPPILAARAGKSLCTCCTLAASRAVRVGNLLPRRQRWRPLGFTIQVLTLVREQLSDRGKGHARLVSPY